MHRKIAWLSKTAGAIVASLLLSGCIKPPDGPPPAEIENVIFQKYNRALAGFVLAPNYRSFEETSARLQVHVSEICSSGDAELPVQLEKAQELWKDANRSWQRINWFKLGPIHDQNSFSTLHQFGNDKQSLQDLSLETFNSTIDTLGLLPVSEHVFFQNNEVPREHCSLLSAASNKLDSIARNIAKEWEDRETAFVASYINGTEPFINPKHATRTTIDQLMQHLRFVIEQKIELPLRKLEQGEFAMFESPYADVTTQNLQANIAAFRIAYIGGGASKEKGLDDFLNENGFVDLAHEVKVKMTFAEQTAGQLPPSFEQTLTTEYGLRTLRNLLVDLRKLQVLMETELLPALYLDEQTT